MWYDTCSVFILSLHGYSVCTIQKCSLLPLMWNYQLLQGATCSYARLPIQRTIYTLVMSDLLLFEGKPGNEASNL